MPEGQEDIARAFYGHTLGLSEVDKPDQLKDRGGCWFKGAGVSVHLGVEVPFRPAKKAHPAFAVGNLRAVRTTLAGAGVASSPPESLPGFIRSYIADPFGNRIELVETAG